MITILEVNFCENKLVKKTVGFYRFSWFCGVSKKSVIRRGQKAWYVEQKMKEMLEVFFVKTRMVEKQLVFMMFLCVLKKGFKKWWCKVKISLIRISDVPILYIISTLRLERLYESYGIRPWGRSTFPGAGAPGRAAQNEQLAWSEHFSWKSRLFGVIQKPILQYRFLYKA